MERWRTIRVGGVRIGSKVVIERNIFLENHHHVLDRGGGLRVVRFVPVAPPVPLRQESGPDKRK